MFEFTDSQESKTFIVVMLMFIGGAISRSLLSPDPFCFKKLIGEMILAVIGTVIIVYAGWMEGLSDVKIIFYGALGSLGGVRVIEWAFKIYHKVNSTNG